MYKNSIHYISIYLNLIHVWILIFGIISVYLSLCLRSSTGQSAQNVPFGHLEAHCHRRYPGNGCWEAVDISFHVTEKLLQLLQHYRETTGNPSMVFPPLDLMKFHRLEPPPQPLCRTALAGLFPDMDSLLRCWWDSARHSTSLNRVLRAIEGWEGSSVMLR